MFYGYRNGLQTVIGAADSSAEFAAFDPLRQDLTTLKAEYRLAGADEQLIAPIFGRFPVQPHIYQHRDHDQARAFDKALGVKLVRLDEMHQRAIAMMSPIAKSADMWSDPSKTIGEHLGLDQNDRWDSRTDARKAQDAKRLTRDRIIALSRTPDQTPGSEPSTPPVVTIPVEPRDAHDGISVRFWLPSNDPIEPIVWFTELELPQTNLTDYSTVIGLEQSWMLVFGRKVATKLFEFLSGKVTFTANIVTDTLEVIGPFTIEPVAPPVPASILPRAWNHRAEEWRQSSPERRTELAKDIEPSEFYFCFGKAPQGCTVYVAPICHFEDHDGLFGQSLDIGTILPPGLVETAPGTYHAQDADTLRLHRQISKCGFVESIFLKLSLDS